jgi:putative transposase
LLLRFLLRFFSDLGEVGLCYLQVVLFGDLFGIAQPLTDGEPGQPWNAFQVGLPARPERVPKSRPDGQSDPPIDARRPVGSELLHHSDRGCQYTSDAYQQTLRTLGIECSMSRTGECYGNAVAERFFWSLKHEWTNNETFDNLESARLSVFKYVEIFYNTVRLHQSFGYKSPEKFETEYAPVLAAQKLAPPLSESGELSQRAPKASPL